MDIIEILYVFAPFVLIWGMGFILFLIAKAEKELL